MKRVFVLFLLFFPAAVFANLQVQNGRMSADLNSESLTNVLDVLRQQTGIKVAVEPEVGNQPISASFQGLPLAAGIKKLFEGTGINYVLIGDEKGAVSLYVGSSERAGQTAQMPGGSPMPGRGVVQPVNPMPMVAPPPPSPSPAPATKVDNQKKGQNPAPVQVPTGGGFVPNGTANGNPNDPNQQVAPRPQIPPEEQAPEDDTDENDQQQPE
jgi:hypothetical protein